MVLADGFIDAQFKKNKGELKDGPSYVDLD